MARWNREYESVAALIDPPPQATVTVERVLLDRLSAVRLALVDEAVAHGWDGEAVDRVLAAGSLEPLTREYIVEFVEEVTREVRVRATDKTKATELANGNGGRLVGVREVHAADHQVGISSNGAGAS